MDDWRVHFRAALRRKGWTQRKLAQASDIPEGTIRAWLRPGAPHRPPIDRAIQLAEALQLSMDELYRGVSESEVQRHLDRLRALLREEIAKEPAAPPRRPGAIK